MACPLLEKERKGKSAPFPEGWSVALTAQSAELGEAGFEGGWIPGQPGTICLGSMYPLEWQGGAGAICLLLA